MIKLVLLSYGDSKLVSSFKRGQRLRLRHKANMDHFRTLAPRNGWKSMAKLWLPGSSEYAGSPFREFAAVSHPILDIVWTPQLFYKEVRAIATSEGVRLQGTPNWNKLNTAGPILNQGSTMFYMHTVATRKQIWRKVKSQEFTFSWTLL